MYCVPAIQLEALGEVLFNTLGKGKLMHTAREAISGKVNPGAWKVEWKGYSTEGLRSKIGMSSAPITKLDLSLRCVITLLVKFVHTGRATHDSTLGNPDLPCRGDEARRKAFNHAAEQLSRRINYSWAYRR